MSLIPPFFPDCVVAIGLLSEDGKTRWAASGFLYARVIDQREGEMTFTVFLITNRHVLAGQKAVCLRFNPQSDEPAREFPLDLYAEDGQPLWTAHPDPDVDVAVVGVNYALLQREAMQVHCFIPPQHVATIAHMKDIGMSEGDGIFILGFPMGLVGNLRNAVIVRQGCVARVRDLIAGAEKSFLVDAVVFPGNSGGPVVSRPQLVAIQGTKGSPDARLIGIVAAYVQYRDVAISTQTGLPRITFEENSGLAVVYPADCIEAAIDASLAKVRIATQVPEQSIVASDEEAAEGAPSPQAIASQSPEPT